MYCGRCGRQSWDRWAEGRWVIQRCKGCGNQIRTAQRAYTTGGERHDGHIDESARPVERILKNHGWLRTCTFRRNKTYKSSEGAAGAVASGETNKPHILALRCYEAIFGKKGATIHLSDGTVIAVRRRFKHDLRCIETPNYLYVEQNPWKKGSKDALRAQQGEKIMWVIEKKTNKFLARVDERGLKKL